MYRSGNIVKKIAVCIPAYSNPQNIDYCIESIIKSNNTFFDIEILLYNNSNKPAIIETCRSLAKNYEFIKFRFLDILLYHHHYQVEYDIDHFVMFPDIENHYLINK